MQVDNKDIYNAVDKTSNKNIHALDFVDCGVIDYYYGLKFETDYNFIKLVNIIESKINSVLDNHFQAVTKSFQAGVIDAVKNSGFGDCFTIKDLNNNPICISDESTNICDELVELDLEYTDRGFKMYAVPKAQKHIQDLYARGNISYEHSKTIYGHAYVNAQRRIFLPPFEAVLNTGETAFIESILYVFENKSAVLRLTVPLKNIDTLPLFKNDLDTYISKFVNVCDMNIKPDDNSIDSLKNCYCNFLVDKEKKIAVISFGVITSIIFSQHHSSVIDIKHIPQNLKEDIFKMLIAPTPKIMDIDYCDETEQCFETSSFILNGTCSIVNKMNKCITIVDDNIRNAGIAIYSEDNVYERVIDDIRDGLEFSFCILMLKRISSHYAFYKKGLFQKNANKIQNEYNNDRIFISFMLSDTYGSVRDQVDFFENKMKYFVDAQNMKDRTDAINNILEQDNATRIQRLQNTLSIGGLVFSGIFGLPAINETISLIRDVFGLIKYNIPILSIDNVSFGIWLVVNGILSYYILFRKRTK